MSVHPVCSGAERGLCCGRDELAQRLRASDCIGAPSLFNLFPLGATHWRL